MYGKSTKMPVVGALCTNTRELGVPPTMRRVQIIEESIRRFLYHGGEVVGMTVLPKELPVPKHLAFDLLRSAEKGSKTPPPRGGGGKTPPGITSTPKTKYFLPKKCFFGPN